MSLPLVFETVAETIPAKTPYLFANPDRVERWRERIETTRASRSNSAGGREQALFKRIAIALFPVTHFGSSWPGVPGVRLISLQKGEGEDQLQTLPAGMVVESLGDHLDAEADAFADTAAVMRCLDLVITSDTSIAHLAGALGILTMGGAPICSRLAVGMLDQRRRPLVSLHAIIPPGSTRRIGAACSRKDQEPRLRGRAPRIEE